MLTKGFLVVDTEIYYYITEKNFAADKLTYRAIITKNITLPYPAKSISTEDTFCLNVVTRRCDSLDKIGWEFQSDEFPVQSNHRRWCSVENEVGDIRITECYNWVFAWTRLRATHLVFISSPKLKTLFTEARSNSRTSTRKFFRNTSACPS